MALRVLKMGGGVEEIRTDAAGWRTVVQVNRRGEPMEQTERPCCSPGMTGEHPAVTRYYANEPLDIRLIRRGVPMQNSLTVWDDEAQVVTQAGHAQVETSQWGEHLRGFAVEKGMPAEAKFWTRRNDTQNGTIFEWNNA